MGILADIPDNDSATEDGPLTQQKVDLTFYAAKGKGVMKLNFFKLVFRSLYQI